jgi:hypothetical protein
MASAASVKDWAIVEPTPDDLIMVDVIKYGLDEGSEWWRVLYFRWLFLPILRFSFKWFRIPMPDARDADGRVSWREGIGIATDEATAKAMCKDEFYRWTPLPVNSALPRESMQYKEQVYPRSTKQDRYLKPAFPLAAVRRTGIDGILGAIRTLDARVERLTEQAREPLST